MSVNKNVVVGVVAALTLGVSSCRKFLDVNQNPNIAQNATMNTILPAAQLYLASAVGNDLQINGSIWAGYWTQSPNASQYRNIEQYNPGQDVFSTQWDNLYSANSNFFQLGKLADSLKNKPYKAISLLMRAYTFQIISDAWGDVPFSQALRGQSADSGITNPKYDSQRVVYMGLLKYIDSAETLLDSTVANNVGNDDLIYGGDLEHWKRFGYTLKLKMLVRLTKREPAFAQAELQKLFASANTQFIETNADNARINFGASSTNRNPLYAEIVGLSLVQNLAGSSTIIDTMNSNGDDRAFVFFKPNGSGNISGITQGDYGTNVPTTSYSIPSAAVGADASTSESGTAPVKFLTATESNFLIAEVAANGWATTPNVDSYYFYNGLELSFNDYGLSAYNYRTDIGTGSPAYWSMYPVTGSVAEKEAYIITQKWFAMCGNQGFEAWTELRRTGYPSFWVASVSSQIGSNVPARFLYPTSESTRNINYPGLAPVTQKVWWNF